MEREERFLQNQKLVGYCLRRLRPPQPEYDDCMQEGYLALWRACESYDESYGTAFSTYAIPYIDGQIRKYLRDKTNTIRIPRAVYGRGDEDEIEKLKNIASLEFQIEDSNTTMENFVAGENNIEIYEERERIDSAAQKALDKMSKWRDLCEEYYWDTVFGEDHGQHYYAKKYNISQPQISRLMRKFKKHIKENL